jgi:hypothetical protein
MAGTELPQAAAAPGYEGGPAQQGYLPPGQQPPQYLPMQQQLSDQKQVMSMQQQQEIPMQQQHATPMQQQAMPMQQQQAMSMQQQQGLPLQLQQQAAPLQPQQMMPMPQQQMYPAVGSRLGAGLPAGIMLASAIPVAFTPYICNPRPPGAPPYERLLLISSRVNEPMRVSLIGIRGGLC